MLTPLQQRKLMKLFCLYDTNNDGAIVRQDFEKIVKKLADFKGWGLRSSKYHILNGKYMQEWKSLEKQADASHNHQVNLEEWFNHYDRLLSDETKYQEEVKTRSELIFEVFDTDQDEKLTQSDWAELLRVYNVSVIYAPLIFPKLDITQDDFLSKEEVLQLFDDFYYSDDPERPANWMFGPY
ncbi:MAG: EF-hand domain-containing protein [Chroococcales cyanobacterium]